MDYRKGGFVARLYLFGGNSIDACQGWWVLAQCSLEAVERFNGSLDLDCYAVAIIQYKAS